MHAIIAEREVETEWLRRHRARQIRRFLKGPIPLSDIAVAARLPGQSLAVFLALHHRAALTRGRTVTLPKSLMDQLGVSRDAKVRALHHLAKSRLVTFELRPGRNTHVSLLASSEI